MPTRVRTFIFALRAALRNVANWLYTGGYAVSVLSALCKYLRYTKFGIIWHRNCEYYLNSETSSHDGVVSGSCCDVEETCALLRCYAGYSGKSLPMFRGNLSFPSCLQESRNPTILTLNLLAPEFYIQTLAHSVCKMWLIQKPKTVALWNKRHFEEKNGECAAC